MLITRTLVIVSAAAGVSLASAALGQSRDGKGEKPQSKQTQPANPDVLAGPAVEDAASEGNDSMMAPARQRRQAATLPLRQWLQQVRALEGVSDEQREQIASITQELDQAQQTFRAEHGRELQQLQQRIRLMRQGNLEPDQAERERLQELEAQSPKPIDYQRRVWDVLSSEQQEALRLRINELEDEMRQQRPRGGQAGRGSEANDGRPAADSDMSGSTPAQRDGGDGMMGGAAGDGSDRQGASGNAAERRRRAAAAAASAGETDRAADSASLDRMARRRVEFLRQFVSPSPSSPPGRGRAAAANPNSNPNANPTRPGAAPTRDEREFTFEESD